MTQGGSGEAGGLAGGRGAEVRATLAVQPNEVPEINAGGSHVVVANQAEGTVKVTFSPPSSNGGASITSYTVTATSSISGARTTESGAGSPIFVTGLSDNNYTFNVAATNDIGTGPQSASVVHAG